MFLLVFCLFEFQGETSAGWLQKQPRFVLWNKIIGVMLLVKQLIQEVNFQSKATFEKTANDLASAAQQCSCVT